MDIREINILYEDNDIIVVEKPYGISSQAERGTGHDMVSLLMNYFYQKGEKPPYVGVVHRLDKNVGGVMVYGKNKGAAGKLSSQISSGNVGKKYLAVVHNGERLDREGRMTDILIRDGRTNTSRVADVKEQGLKDARKAELTYRVIETVNEDGQNGEKENISLVEINLITGRHHQIRVQFSHRDCPLVGDRKYGIPEQKSENRIGLFCCSLSFVHPASGKKVTYQSQPSGGIFDKFGKYKEKINPNNGI